ncbi:hypothetical protein OROGR_029038 [Orobanche gracilis]
MGSGSDGNSRDSERNEYKEKPYEINLRIKNPDQVQIHCHGKTVSLSSMLREKGDHHVAAVAEEERKLQRISDELIERVLKQEIALENKKRRLDSWSEELNKREEFLERERQKLGKEKMENDLRNTLQFGQPKASQRSMPKSDENPQREAKEEYQRRVEEYHRRVEEAKKEEDACNQKGLELKWSSEYEMEKLRYDEIRQMPKMWQEAFKKLIAGFCNLLTSSSNNIIGLKRMWNWGGGHNKRFPIEGTGVEDVELCSLWQEQLKKTGWNPFKIAVNKYGDAKILINEDDNLLRGLKDRWGDEVYDAAITALKELQNDKLLRFGFQFPLLWNFKEKREANIKEVVVYIIIQLRTLKRTTP